MKTNFSVSLSPAETKAARGCAKTLQILALGIVVFEVVFFLWWLSVAFSTLFLPVDGDHVEAHLTANYKLFFHVLGVLAFLYLYGGSGGPFGVLSVFIMLTVLILDTYTLIEFWRFLHESPHEKTFWAQFSLAIYAEFMSVVALAWVTTEYFHHKSTGIRFDLLHDEPSVNVLATDAKMQ